MKRFPDELKEFINNTLWTFAKTYADTWPHHYIVRDRVDEKLFVKLRKWRNEESEKQGIDPSRVFSNKQLKNMARKRPKSEACLASVEGLEGWKLEQYAAAVLEALG